MDEHVVPVVARTELTAILRRLEAATSRLEDMAATTADSAETGSSANTNAKAVGAPPTPAPTGPLPPPPTIQKPVVEELPASIQEFDTFLSGAVKNFVALSKSLGGPQEDQVGCDATRAYVGFVLIGNIGSQSAKGIRGSTQIPPDYYESKEARSWT